MNKTKDYEFTVVVPVFNEEESIARLTKALADFMQKSIMKACVLFVNDGSKDSSLDKIKVVCRETPGFYYISLGRNSGLSTALKAGIDTAESPYVGYIDADLQTTPDDFNLLLEHAAEYGLVTGIRANRKDTVFKRMQSKIANAFRRKMTGDGMQDTGCPLKVMHADLAKRVPFFNGMHRFLPALFIMMGSEVIQIPVRHFPRTEGVSKYHLSNRLVKPFIDCFAYRWMRSRYISYTVADDDITLSKA